MPQSPWEDAVVRAAAEASRLQPLAWFLALAAALSIVGEYFAAPAADAIMSGGDWAIVAEQAARGLIEAGPAVALVWGLFETAHYLGRLARGEVWGPATMALLGKVGEAIVAAAVLAMFIGPTVEAWITSSGAFQAHFEPLWIALAGLGLVLALISRVVRNVVAVAAALKAENEQIV